VEGDTPFKTRYFRVVDSHAQRRLVCLVATPCIQRFIECRAGMPQRDQMMEELRKGRDLLGPAAG